MVQYPTSTAAAEVPADPVSEALAEAIADILPATVQLAYAPEGTPVETPAPSPAVAAATGSGPPGWQVTYTVRLHDRVAGLVGAREGSPLVELLRALPAAAVKAAGRLPGGPVAEGARALSSAFRRALRDTVAAEVLTAYGRARLGRLIPSALVTDTIDYLVELGTTRVESHDLTHGVVIADVYGDEPRLEFAYPADVRAAKRAPLLFDGQRSVLVVDSKGRARTELQRHRLHRLAPGLPIRLGDDDLEESGSLVAEATRSVGGLGFFLGADRSLRTFVDGVPLLVRRGAHWTAFPVELTASIETMIGGGSVAAVVARAAFMISARPDGAILAIVDDGAALEGVVSRKDRYDLRHEIGIADMRPETRLHHLIDAEDLDEHTLVRLASLDGATVLDREGRLLAYGAVVASGTSEHEGARTAAAKTLSKHARVVLKVSMDGDITIFRGGVAVTTLLRSAPESLA